MLELVLFVEHNVVGFEIIKVVSALNTELSIACFSPTL